MKFELLSGILRLLELLGVMSPRITMVLFYEAMGVVPSDTQRGVVTHLVQNMLVQLRDLDR